MIGVGPSFQDRPAPRVIAKRLSNALIKDAKSNVGGLGIFKHLQGGLWVGGTTYLTDDAVTFVPNAMNEALHTNDCSVSIPLHDIVGFGLRFGILTRIIGLRTTTGTLSIRCFGAKSFMQTIDAQLATVSYYGGTGHPVEGSSFTARGSAFTEGV